MHTLADRFILLPVGFDKVTILAIPTVEPIPDTDQSMTENNQPQIEPEKPEIEKMPEVEPEVAKPEMVQPDAESNIRNGAKEQQETTKDETDLQPDLLKFNLDDLTDEALNIGKLEKH